MDSYPFFFLISLIPLVYGHGCITKVVANGQTACAVNARDDTGCTPTNGLKLRELIPRSGNDGVCANPPGCEAQFICDWCGLEKTQTFNQLVPGKWWTGTPAAHWDKVSPQFPCMSKQQFGANGKMNVRAGDSVTANFYINADHSGLYRYELMCGNTATNANFNPLTPWLALHATKDGGALGADRVAGSTMVETTAYFQKTTCTGAACSYRMNKDSEDPLSNHCKNNLQDCYAFDTFVIPSTFQCNGDAILRWVWNSAEGPETYANCLDLNVQAAVQPPSPTPVSPNPVSPTPASLTPSPPTPASLTPSAPSPPTPASITPAPTAAFDPNGQIMNGVSFGIMSFIFSIVVVFM